MSKNFTLKEIATQLGISISTISKVLNDRPGISNKTKERIINAIKEYNYIPNASARSLVTSKTKIIATVGKKREPRMSSEDYYHRSLVGMEEELKSRSYHIISISLTDEEMNNPSDLLFIRENRCDGYILRGPGIKSRFILYLKSINIPTILFGNELRETDIDNVVCQDTKGSYQVTKHLLDHGHKDIVFFSGPFEWSSNIARREGYEKALRELSLEPRIIYMPDTTIDYGKEYLPIALKKYPDNTAIVAVNDATAIGIINKARELGLKVPEDIAVVGFDDIDWASISYPQLTTVHVYLKEMGRLAAHRLIEIIENPESPPVRISVTTKLIIRNSCGCK